MIAWLRGEIDKAPRFWGVLCVVAVSFLAYANSFDVGFHFDDSHHIVQNPYLQDLEYVPEYYSNPSLFSALPDHHMYRPVLLTSFAFNYYLGGHDPFGWRLTAIALHALVAAGVYLLAVSLSRSPDQGSGVTRNPGALVAALLFAVHPVFTETVDYASARSSLLATGFVVWAMLLHRGMLGQKRPALRIVLEALSLVFFAAAFLSKEIAVVYPALLIAIAWVERRGRLAVVPAIAVAVLLLVIRKMVLGTAVIDFAAREAAVATADIGSGGARSIAWNLFTQSRVILAYIALFLWPSGLCLYRDVRVSESMLEMGVLGGGMLILALLFVAWRSRSTRPMLSIGILWFFLALAPTSSIIPLNQVMNEHRLYLPGVGVAIMLALAMRRMPRPAWVTALAVLCLLTWNRNRDWSDPVRIWESAVRVSPSSDKSWNAFGAQLRIAGRDEEAETAFHSALKLQPESWEATFNLGTLNLHREQYDDAEMWLERSLEISPGAQRSRWFLAEVWYRRGELVRAEKEFEDIGSGSIRLYDMTRYPLAKFARDRGDLETARALYREALECGFDPVAAHLGLADLEKEAGRLQAATAEAELAMKTRPHDARPYVFLAHLYAGTGRAPGYLMEAGKRGYRISPEERLRVLSGDRS